jgi:hypothetical protein
VPKRCKDALLIDRDPKVRETAGPQTAGFVEEQHCRAARLLVVEGVA